MLRKAKTLQAIRLAVAVGIANAAPAGAAVLTFTGSATAAPMVAADASCAPLPFRGIIPPADRTSTSNLGNFSYSHNVCTQGATGPVNGIFTIDFGTSSVTGLLDGMSIARAGTPGLFDQMFNYVLTNGTGRFAGVTGSFTNIGTADVRGGPPARLTLNFAGSIDAPGVPEPASWAMMIVGFGLVSGLARQRQREPGVPRAACA